MKSYNYALLAFNEILEKYKEYINYNETQFELAKTHYYLVIFGEFQNDSEKENENIKKAIQIFELLIQKNNIKNFSDFSAHLLGDIYLEYYFDVDKAIYYYNYVTANFRNSKVFNSSVIKLGDGYVIKGDLKKAQKTYGRIINNKKISIAKYKQAEVDYFLGNSSDAKTKYNQIIEMFGLADSLANNSLERKMLIESFVSDSTGLKKYAHGELLVFQKKYSEAIEVFYEIIKPERKIATKAGKLAAHLLIKLNKLSEASTLLTKVIEQFSEDYHIDEFIYMLAGTEEKLGNLQKSFELYQKILNEFGTSMYYEKSRERARELNERIESEKVPG